MILFIKHIDIEGPDTLEIFFKQNGFSTKIIELANGDTLPGSFDGIDAVISLGGPMNVYEEDKFPFFKSENRFIAQVVAKEIPIMGICLGSQLLAKACDGKIKRSPEQEIGFLPVQLTQQGCEDPLFKDVDQVIDMFHWHNDMSELPKDAVLLAESKGCPHQAFKVGSRAYGIQFHFEVTEPTIRKWIEAYFSKDDPVDIKRKQIIMDNYQKNKQRFDEIAGIISNNFLDIINAYNNKETCV